MTDQPTPEALREQYAAAIRPTLLMGLQDAELDGPGGTQRINEWVDWIAKELAEVRDGEMERLRADLDRVQQAACRTAENLRVAEAAARAGLDQPQQPTEDEARQLPCSLWLLSNGHAPHWWQPQPGMADVLCPGAPRKAVVQPPQPTA